jgi:hypothetical protein
MEGQREQISGRPETALQPGARLAVGITAITLAAAPGRRDSLILATIRNNRAARR